MIDYTSDISILDNLEIEGFFVGWPNPPNKENFKRILRGSYKVVLAAENDKLIGFINCVSDGVLSAYIPLLEVLPSYQGKNIGKELVRKMLEGLNHLYMIDLLCDEELIPYYKSFGMEQAQGACLRNYDCQSGSIA